MQLVKFVKAIQAGSLRRQWRLACTIAISIACTPPRDQREIVAADAETFEAIVRSQMMDSVNANFLRVDSRPAGDKEILPSAAAPATGFDADSAAQSVSDVDTSPITDQRKDILHDLHVEEGGPFFFPECGGFRTQRDSAAEHLPEKCPRIFRRYVTVGLPARGAGAVLNKARRPEAPAPDTTTGELWTVLVTEASIGPGGQQWRQYAWLFRRDQQTGRLGVSEKFLLSWAE